MIKFKLGDIGTYDGRRQDIIVKAKAPNTLKQYLIGGGMMLVGITYLTVTAFKNGSEAFSDAEFNTLNDLGLIKDSMESTIEDYKRS